MNEPERLHELAGIVRRILEDDNYGQSSSLSAADRVLLCDAALLSLEPGLQDLLKDLHMTDLAIPLIMDYSFKQDDLAQALQDSNRAQELGIETAALSRLKDRLEVRGLLKAAGVGNPSWLDEFCRRFPTRRQLQQQRWVDIQGQISSSGGTSTVNERIITELWAAGNDIRCTVFKYKLPPIFTDKLESEGINCIDDIDQRRIEQLIAEESDPKAKSKLSRMFHEETATAREEKNRAEESRLANKVRVEEAIKTVRDLKIEAATDHPTERDNLKDRIQELHRMFKTDGLTWPTEWDSTALKNSLSNIENDLIGACSDLDPSSVSVEPDEQLIARCSAGLALHGMYFGGNPELLGHQARRPLLREPVYCQLVPPLHANKCDSVSFSSAETGAEFRRIAISSGYTLASGLRADGCVFGGGNSKTLTTTAAAMHFNLFYTKAFCIPRDQMRLSREAEGDARAVINMERARKFLSEYGSHVSSGMHHLGGILWRIVEVKTNDETEASILQTLAGRQISNEESLGFSGFGFEAGTSVKHTSFNFESETATSENARRDAEISLKAEAHGPNTTNPDLFYKVLQSNNRTWHIIDRDDFGSLVPIWDFLKDDSSAEIRTAAQLLRTAWLQNAGQYNYIPIVQFEIQRAKMDALIADAVKNNACHLSSQIRNFECGLPFNEAFDELDRILVKTLNLDLISATDSDLMTTLVTIFYIISRCRYESGRTLLEAMQRSYLPNFLDRVAELEGKPESHHLLRKVFDATTREQLEQASIVLTPKLRKIVVAPVGVIGNSKVGDTTRSWDVPSVDISDLAESLSCLKSEIMDGVQAIDLTLLNQRVSEVLAKNIGQQPQSIGSHAAVAERLINYYGWTEDGFLVPLTDEGMHSLIEDVRNITHPEANLTKPRARQPEEADWISIAQDDINENNSSTEQRSTSLSAALHSYSSMLVDRPLVLAQKAADTYILDCLRHRLDLALPPLTANYIEEHTEEHMEEENAEDETSFDWFDEAEDLVSSSTVPVSSLFDIMLGVVNSFDVTGKMEIFRLLLNRRNAVPLITPSNRDSSPFMFNISALSFIETTTVGGTVRLSKDTSMLRIAVISCRTIEQSQTAAWMKELFNIHSVHAIDRNTIGGKLTECTSVAELGCGFIVSSDVGTQARTTTPCMVLHVIGDFTPLWPFLRQYTDCLLVESDPDPTRAFSPPNQHTIKGIVKWIPSPITEKSKVITKPFKHRCFTGNLGSTVPEIARLLVNASKALSKEIKEVEGYSRTPLARFSLPGLLDVDPVNLIELQSVVKRQPFEKLRLEDFKMQLSYVKEAAAVNNLHSIKNRNNPGEETRIGKEIDAERRRRYEQAYDVSTHEFVRLFIGVLRQPNPVSRVLGIRQLEELLVLECATALRQRKEAEQAAWTACEEERRRSGNYSSRGYNLTRLMDHWRRAKQSYNLTVVSLEHLWREVSHLYVAEPNRYSLLPRLAAQHLIDGFALELMDGDAGMMNLPWIQAVLRELETMLIEQELPSHEVQQDLGSICDNGRSVVRPRIFVLSVMGVQSSGKSTLLNIMFGVRLRTSVGQCTRGVNMQLLKVEGRAEYDYILLLDTEGVRAPEYSELPESEIHDNRMATFALLPADATIVVNNGEDDKAVKEILPIVLSAYQDSKLAESNGGQLSSMMFFVYTRIDTTQTGKLSEIKQSLILALREAFEQVSKLGETAATQREDDYLYDDGVRVSSTQLSVNSAFRDFRYDAAKDGDSDIKVLGNIKRDHAPPNDLPITQYGEDLMQLREHIHSRLTSSASGGWRTRNIQTFSDYLETVWQCILSSNFQLNFKSAVERVAHDDLEKKMSEAQRSLTQHYDENFSKLEKELVSHGDNKAAMDAELVNRMQKEFESRLEISVEYEITELDKRIRRYLSEPRWEKWQTDQKIRWERVLLDQKNFWNRMLGDIISNQCMFGAYVAKYQERMRKRIRELFQGDTLEARHNREGSKEVKQKMFEDIFSAFVQEAKGAHPPMASEVDKIVLNIYKNHQSIIADNIKLTKSASQLSSSWQRGVTVVNDIIHSWVSGPNSRSDEQEVLNRLTAKINRDLHSVQRYSDRLVIEAIDSTNLILRGASKGLRQKGHEHAYSLVVSLLKTAQDNWDMHNSVSVRLKNEQNQMWIFFDNVSKGVAGAELLTATLHSIFQLHMANAFEHELIPFVAAVLKTRQWVLDPKIMQAHLDLDLLNMLERGEESRVLEIFNPEASRKHYQKVQHNLICKTMQSVLQPQWNLFRSQVISSLKDAAVKAKRAESRRAAKFLSALRTSLANLLMTTYLSLKVQSGGSDFDSCDGETPDVFDRVQQDVANRIGEHMPTISSAKLEELCSKVLQYLIDRQNSQDIRPRCGHPCPRCRSPCILSANHEADNLKHDTYHQPEGLMGVYWSGDMTVAAESCTRNVQRDHWMKHEEKSYKYTAFESVYPDWKLPSIVHRLKLREYIFYNYQATIASEYLLLPCPNVPSDYNWSPAGIRVELENMIRSP
ncbi:hypothetical protein BC936DRAFT_139201, partial [Jimgerdemannia flammicorona]